MTIDELHGCRLEHVDDSAPSQWIFRFHNGHLVNIEGDWRIVLDGRVALGARDHSQLFGRDIPVDAKLEAEAILKGRPIVDASVGTLGDLAITIDGGARLESFASSSGFESCTVSLTSGRRLVVVGGGEIVEF